MTEQNAEQNREADPLASGQVSGNVSQEASKTETVTKADLEAVLNEVRGLQGKLDKDADAAAKRIQSNLEERMKQLGVTLTPEQQMQNRLLEMEERLTSVGQGDAKPQPQTVAEPQKPNVDIAKIKEAYADIDFNSPEVLQAVSANFNNEDGLLVALGKIKVSGTAKPKPSAATVASPQGSVKTSAKIEELQSEYDRLASDPASFTDPKLKQQRKELIKQMEEIEG